MGWDGEQNDLVVWFQHVLNTIPRKDASHMQPLADRVETAATEDVQLTPKLDAKVDKDILTAAKKVVTLIRANFVEALQLRLFSTGGDDKSKKSKVQATQRSLKKLATWEMVGVPVCNAVTEIKRKVV